MPERTKRIAPYLPFRTFLGSLDALSQGVPPVIDRTLWRNQAGLMQGLIMNAYRFFGLVDEDAGDTSTEYLDKMAHHPEQRASVLRTLIQNQYSDLLDVCDLTSATMKMLEDLFEDVFAVSGATKQKAITFFLKAAKFADMRLSPYLQSQLRNVGPRKKRGSRQRADQADNTEQSREDVFLADSPKAESVHSVHLESGGTLTISITANPFKMPVEDRNFVFGLIDKLQEYEAQHRSAENGGEEEEE